MNNQPTPLSETHLFREIQAQPAGVARLLADEWPTIAALAQTIARHAIDHVVIAARGTSDNAGRYAQYVFGAHNGLQVALATPSLFTLYDRPVRFGNALVLGISQSGQSPDIVSVLAEARRQGRLTAALTNTPDSPLAQEADFVVDLQAGSERAVAATKTYTAALAAVAALSAALSGDSAQQAALHAVPEALARCLAAGNAAAALAERLRYMQHCVVIGRGFNYATAYEAALKLKELTYSVAEPYSSADFLHGPLALLSDGFPVLLFAPSGALSAELRDFAQTLRARSAELIVVSDEATLLALGRRGLPLAAAVPEWLSPLTAILPAQLLALHLAHTRGYNVDAPRAIRKVTETV